jgi:hypothetical protein
MPVTQNCQSLRTVSRQIAMTRICSGYIAASGRKSHTKKKQAKFFACFFDFWTFLATE